MLSRLLKEKIDAYLPDKYGQLSRFVGRYRDRVKNALPDVQARVSFWETVLQGSIAQLVFSGHEDTANDALLMTLEAAKQGNNIGEAYLIDASAGKVELLTLQAFHLLQQSELVFHDASLSSEIQIVMKQGGKRECIDMDSQSSATDSDLSIQGFIKQVKQRKRVARLFADQSNFYTHKQNYADALNNEGLDFRIALGISSEQ